MPQTVDEIISIPVIIDIVLWLMDTCGLDFRHGMNINRKFKTSEAGFPVFGRDNFGNTLKCIISLKIIFSTPRHKAGKIVYFMIVRAEVPVPFW